MLSGLTIRGRCLLAAGVAASVSALVLNERDLLRVAAFVLALPLLAAWWTWRTRHRLHARRDVDPPQVSVGERADIRLTLSHTGRFPVGGAELVDQVPRDLGQATNFRLDTPPRPGSSITAHHTVRPELRGVHRLGPLRTRVADPFGMSEYHQEIGGESRFTVIPKTVELNGLPGGSGTGDGMAGTTRPYPGQGVDDAMVREYRRGDDLRRVHWKTTARRSELMVRVDEHPWHGGTTVLLDRRAAAHRGSGVTASVEWAVSAAASCWLHMHAHGQPVRLVTEDGHQLDTAATSGHRDGGDRMLRTLAGLRTSTRRDLLFEHDPGQGQELIAVLGEITAAGVGELTKFRPARARSLAILLDVPRWSSNATTGFDPHRSATRLQDAGWSTVIVTPDTPIAQAWQQLCATSGAAEGVMP